VLKEVGSDALFALLRTLDGPELEKATAYYRHVRDDDVALAVAQTDVKGDRSLPPHAQAEPDLYLHVVDEDADSITVRGLASLAALRSRPGANGIQQPDPLAVNMAKYHFAHGFHDAVAILVDLSGGLLATGPGGEDWDNPDIRAVLAKYYAAVPAERRLKLLHFIADLTARDYGGYQAVLATHAEGSLEAEKLQIARSYDPGAAMRYVEDLAGIAE